LEARFKNFIFKYVQGQLMFNKVVARFDPEVDKECTFCLLIRYRAILVGGINVEDETVHHLFWECESIQAVLLFIKRGLNEPNMTKLEFFIGKDLNGYNRTMVRIYITHIAWWYIYKMSRCKKLPSEKGIRGAMRVFQECIYKT
jgi:hypothetical protein